jgi:hypothetical protein
MTFYVLAHAQNTHAHIQGLPNHPLCRIIHFSIFLWNRSDESIRSNNIIADLACKLLKIVSPETWPAYLFDRVKHPGLTAMKFDPDFSLGDR